MITRRTYKLTPVLAAAVAALFLPSVHLKGQSPNKPESGEEVRRPKSTFTLSDGKQVSSRSRSGRFPLVALSADETVDIALQLPARSPANSAMGAYPLDGGKIVSVSRRNQETGELASIRFQAGGQPGLYRVVVPGFGPPTVLQFWVEDRNNPNAKIPVINPGR
jgi:hypothetical protein